MADTSQPLSEARELVKRLRDAADCSANGGGNWYQLIHRCRDAASFIERGQHKEVTPGMVERVARALFEADEDLSDMSIQDADERERPLLQEALGPRSRWDDPRNAPILDAFRYRARKALTAALSEETSNG